MASRLLCRRYEQQDDLDNMSIEPDSLRGKAQNQFGDANIVDAEMRNGDAVADVTETLVVVAGCLGVQLRRQACYRASLTETVDNLREVALEAEDDLRRRKKLGNHDVLLAGIIHVR